MNSAPRFWPLAALILLPVLVLAGVAGYGLTERRAVLETEAFMESTKLATRLRFLWDAALRESCQTREVLLYPLNPLPGEPGTQALRLEQAVLIRDVAVLRDLAEAQPQAEMQHTSSGLPVRVLAAWHLWRETRSREDAEALALLSAGPGASVLTAGIMGHLARHYEVLDGDWVQVWQENWQDQERRRALAGRLPAGETRGLVTDHRGAPAYVQRTAVTGTAAVVEAAELSALSKKLAAALRQDAPAWAAFSVRAGEEVLGDEEWSAMTTAEANTGAFRLVVSANWPLVLADYHNMVRWAAAVSGTALLTAFLGLTLVRRTLNKERRLGELKSQFVSSVSHELRAPVGSLRLMAEGLASGKVSGPPADEFHRLMASEGARLSSLIENVLDFARIEQGRKQYTFAETDIIALVHDAVKVMTPQAEARGQKIVTDLPPLPFIPQVDAGALQQALINLLDNAIKFSPPNVARHSNVEFGADSTFEPERSEDRLPMAARRANAVSQCRAACGDIRVTLAHDPSAKTWSLSVADDGPGIPAAEHERIFERFYRLGNELRRETTGTGIGLAIVKHVVEGHGGNVRVESEPGSGSVFTMEFPERSAGMALACPCLPPDEPTRAG